MNRQTKRIGKKREPRVLMLSPLEFLRKIASIIPTPRKHMVRYHGIFAPNANGRDKLAGAAFADPPEPPSSL